MKLTRLILPTIIVGLATGCTTTQNTLETSEFQLLQNKHAQLEMENQQLRSSLDTLAAPTDMKDSMLPPNALPGHCYARVVIPATYTTEMQRILAAPEQTEISVIPARFETVLEQVLISEAYEELSVIPATYKTITEQVLVKEATSELITHPAEYKTVTEQVLVKPAYTTWEKGRGPIEKIDDATGEIMCLVEVPAEYNTVTRQELVHPERTESVLIPAVYDTITRTVVDQPARTETVTIPAVYDTIEVVKQVEAPKENVITTAAVYTDMPKQVVVAEADMEWREILCETNTTPDVVRRLQQALMDNGYNPVWVDGVYGTETRAAVAAYQRDKGLATGGLTMRTLEHLGVRL